MRHGFVAGDCFGGIEIWGECVVSVRRGRSGVGMGVPSSATRDLGVILILILDSWSRLDHLIPLP